MDFQLAGRTFVLGKVVMIGFSNLGLTQTHLTQRDVVERAIILSFSGQNQSLTSDNNWSPPCNSIS